MADYDQDELVRASCRRQVAEAAKALRLSPQKTGYAVTALERSGAIERDGTAGRAFCYRKANLA